MAKKRRGRSEHWKDEPDEHDFPAAADYLGLLFPRDAVDALVAALRAAPSTRHKAKDLMRASGLALLPAANPEVRKDLDRVESGERLSPVLLVRGDGRAGTPLIVADGYHRICASYHVDEDALIPCRLVDA